MLKSKLISNLEKSSNKNLIKNIKKNGTPIFEKIENNNKELLLTFIYFGNEKTNNVTILGEFPCDNFKENYLNKLTNKNIWFKSYIVPNDIKFTYKF
jgi:enterochelin esterase family protein